MAIWELGGGQKTLPTLTILSISQWLSCISQDIYWATYVTGFYNVCSVISFLTKYNLILKFYFYYNKNSVCYTTVTFPEMFD